MRLHRFALAASALVYVAACTPQPGPEAPATASTSGVTSAAPASGASAPASGAAPVVTGDAPTLTRTTGPRAAEDLPALSAQAESWQVKDGAVYVEVAMPDDLAALPKGSALSARLVVEGPRYALAVPAGEGRVSDRPLAFVRFTGTTKPGDFEVLWSQPSLLKGARQTITVDMDDAAAGTELDERYFEAASKWFRHRGAVGVGRDDLFHAYAGARLERLANLTRPVARRRPARVARGEVADTMRLYTGLTSIDEALQSDRGLLVESVASPELTIPLAKVESIPLPGHPWDELIAAHPNRATPQIEHLASFVPADAIYLYFHDLRTLVRLAEDVDDLLRPLGRMLEQRSGDRRLSERYERQLAIARSGLAKTLGHVAVKGVALITADPFLRDGTDVGVLFHVRNRALLDQALASYEAKTRARRPDLKSATVQIGRRTARRLYTDDGEVNRLQIDLADDVLALVNTTALAKRLVAVAAGTAPALAKSGEYRFFRLDAPADPKAEAGFAFIGDAQVSKAISPAVKILQARRMRAQSELFAVNNAALLYGWLNGEAPANAKAMIKAGLLDPSEMTHFGGGAITFDRDRGASSAEWGRPSRLRPLSEKSITRVSEHERGAYRLFSASYQRYWKGFIDPVGVRIQRSEDGKTLTLDARMMPLIQSSDYNEIERMVGRTRMVPAPPPDGLRSVLAVGADASLRKTVDQLGRSFTGSRDIGLGWLGDWVMVGVADHGGLWDAALAMGEMPGTRGRTEYGSMDTRKKVINRVPLYVGAQVKQKLGLAATLTALKGMAESAAPGMVTWGPSGAHRGVSVVTVAEQIDGDGISVHYATAKDVLLIALDLGVLHAQIDAVLDGKRSHASEPDDDAAVQASLSLVPKASGTSWVMHTLLGVLERGTMTANRSAALAFESLSVGRGGLPADPEARARVALDWMGQIPVSPHGGTFSIDERGVVNHSIYGSALAPSVPELPVPGSRVTAFIEALERLDLSLSFFGEGQTRGLRSRITWTRR